MPGLYILTAEFRDEAARACIMNWGVGGNVLMYFDCRKCVDQTRSNSSGLDEAIILS